MRDELNEALKQLDRVSMVCGRGTDIREHVDSARSQVTSALLCVLKREADDLREHLAEMHGTERCEAVLGSEHCSFPPDHAGSHSWILDNPPR